MKSSKIPIIALGTLTSITTITGAILGSNRASADDVVDTTSITVPVSCTMSGTGQDTHHDEVPNGTSKENIGTTTIKAFCNDSEGFAIYAVGFGDDTLGTTTLQDSNLDSSFDINTGTTFTGTSQWAMKLGVTAGTYTPIISGSSADPEAESGDTDYSTWAEVPSQYTRVAYRTSGTDVDNDSIASPEGATLTTTYKAYISPTQPSGTYAGKVKYIMVHPNDGNLPGDGVQVTYNSNGLTFPGGTTSNQVTYRPDCTNAYYISTTPGIGKSSNVADDGTRNTGYASDANGLVPVTVIGADRVKVVVRYGLDSNVMLAVIEGNYDGQGEPEKYEMLQGQANGTATYTFDGDAVTFFFMNQSGSAPSSDYDYGFYAEVYGIYDTEPSTPATTEICSYTASTGTYIEPNHYKGSWFINDIKYDSESDIASYITDNYETLSETGLTINAYNPLAIMYDGNTNTGGTMDGFYTKLESTSDTPDLMAPNYYKTGYGFAGWSENPNAVVNGSDTIYGPNEMIDASNLTFNQDENKTAMLYAVWVQSSGTMQGWSGCPSMTDGQIIALTDNRDNNIYTVGKMQDGNCWMMENLRLDNTATLSSSNTNNPASGFISIVSSTDEWCEEDSEACINQNKLNTNNTNLGGTNASNIPLINAPGQYIGNNASAGSKGIEGDRYSWYSYGSYYNWYTATAGTGTYSVSSGNATGDICPNGWSIPIGYISSSDKGQYSALDSAMGGTGSYEYSVTASNRWRSYPNNFVYAGDWRGSAAASRGGWGNYWSRTASNSVYARDLSFHSDVVVPDHGSGNKQNGLSVRCLASGM